MEVGDSKKFLDIVEYAESLEHIREESAAMSTKESVNRLESNRSRTRGNQWTQRQRSRERSPSVESVVCYRCNNKGHFAYQCKSKLQKRFIRTSDYRNRQGFNNTNSVVDSDRSRTEEMEDDFEDMVLDESINNVRGIKESNLNRDRVCNFSNTISSVLGKNINSVKTALVEMQVESMPLRMEVDTGSCVTVCGSNDYKKYFGHLKLERCVLPLAVISGERLKILGKLSVNVETKKGKFTHQSLIVIDSKQKFIPLLGRDWLEVLTPN